MTPSLIPNQCPHCLTIDDLSPEDFRIGATDGFGHRERIQVPFYPAEINRLTRVFESKSFPYKTKNGIVRHGLKRHLDLLERLGSLPSMAQTIDAMLGVIAHEEAMMEMEETMKRTETILATPIHRKYPERSVSIVQQLRVKIQGMSGEEPWKAVWEAEFRERFASYVPNVGAMNMNGKDEI